MKPQIIFGLTCVNDVTALALLTLHTAQWTCQELLTPLAFGPTNIATGPRLESIDRQKNSQTAER
jgi:hypothetical protein